MRCSLQNGKRCAKTRLKLHRYTPVSPFDFLSIIFARKKHHAFNEIVVLQGPWDEGDEAWGLGNYSDACTAYLRAACNVKAAVGWEQRHVATVAAVEMVLSLQRADTLPALVTAAVTKAAADWLRELADE